jgi:hypothetical protein
MKPIARFGLLVLAMILLATSALAECPTASNYSYNIDYFGSTYTVTCVNGETTITPCDGTTSNASVKSAASCPSTDKVKSASSCPSTDSVKSASKPPSGRHRLHLPQRDQEPAPPQATKKRQEAHGKPQSHRERPAKPTKAPASGSSMSAAGSQRDRQNETTSAAKQGLER